MDQSVPRQSLFREPPGGGADPPEAAAPNLLDQIVGVFTAPVPLFRQLAEAPRWGWALLTSMAFTLAMMLIWAGRVDADALLRPLLERNPKVAKELIGQAIELQGRLLPVLASLGVLLGQPAVSLFMALLLWLVGRAAPGPGGNPSYRQALSAAVVPGLVSLPKALLVGWLCLASPVHGMKPDAISPLSLGVLFQSGHGKPDALLTGFDLFVVANLVLVYLAARHIMGLRPGAALVGTGAGAALLAGLQIMSG